MVAKSHISWNNVVWNISKSKRKSIESNGEYSLSSIFKVSKKKIKRFKVIFLFRIIWAIGLGYIILACVTSNGGIVNSILSWPVWLPLSRLSYCLYLFHTVVILFFNSVQDHTIHMQDSNIVNFIFYFIC